MNFKHLFFTTILAASFGLVACDDSSSANSSNGNPNNNGKQGVFSDAGQTYCNVTTTSNSVTVDMALDGEATYTSTVTDAGGRYKTILSEYWYASASDAKKECDDQKIEASSWRDGSYQVSCSGNRIYVNEIDEGSLRDHESDFRNLCRQFEARYGSSTGKNNSTTNNGSNGSKDEPQCNASQVGNSVILSFVYKNYANEMTISLRQTASGPSTVVSTKVTYPNETVASSDCKDAKRDAEYYSDGSKTVSCSGNIVLTETVSAGTGEYDSFERFGEEYCESIQNAYKSGELQRSYDELFGN